VLLETSGERDSSTVDPRVHRIMDLKAPGSGESHRNRWENIAHLGPRDEVKIVIADRSDYEWARGVIEEHALAERVHEVLLSPVWGELDPKTLVEWVLQDDLPVRVQIQMHKVIWGPDTRGV
jgi:7-carboxy-7-deazaguanine synthase